MTRPYGPCLSFVLAIALSGCASLSPDGHGALGDLSEAKTEAAWLALSAEQLELGRDRIRAGNFASALEPLKLAALHPDHAAAAHNAIGVAYAKLGRKDIALRFMTLALAEDPASAKYAANLALLRQGGTAETLPPGAAEARTAELPAPAAAVAPREPHSAFSSRNLPGANGSTVIATGSGDHIERLSSREVRVGAAPAPRYMAGPRNAVAITYPLRLALTDSGERKPAGKADDTGYPVRIRF